MKLHNILDLTERAEVLLGDDTLLKAILRLSYASRNELVHRGEFPGEEVTDVSLLKAVVERCIFTLDRMVTDFPKWPDLESYYTYARTQQNDLDHKARTIRKIQWVKSKKL